MYHDGIILSTKYNNSSITIITIILSMRNIIDETKSTESLVNFQLVF